MSTFNASTAYDDTKTFVSHAQSQADTAITRLTSSAAAWSNTVLTAITALDLAAPSEAAGTKPSLLTLTLPDFTAADFSALAASDLPAPPSLAGATSSMWSESFWSNLKTLLGNFTDDITGSDNIDSVVVKLSNDTTKLQVALYAKDYERRTQVLRDLYSAADANTGAKGFSYPNSMTTALKMDAQQKFQFDMSQTARDLIDRIFEWSKSNLQFAVQQSVAAHGQDMDFNLRYLDTTTKVYSETVQALVSKYREDVAAEVAKAKTRIEEWTGQVDTEIRKQIGLEEIRVKEASFDLEVAKTNGQLSVEHTRNAIADFQARVQSFIETAKTNLTEKDENIKNQISAATAAANAAIAMAAGASVITLNTGGA